MYAGIFYGLATMDGVQSSRCRFVDTGARVEPMSFIESLHHRRPLCTTRDSSPRHLGGKKAVWYHSFMISKYYDIIVISKLWYHVWYQELMISYMISYRARFQMGSAQSILEDSTGSAQNLAQTRTLGDIWGDYLKPTSTCWLMKSILVHQWFRHIIISIIRP